jgi:hypothetical protein
MRLEEKMNHTIINHSNQVGLLPQTPITLFSKGNKRKRWKYLPYSGTNFDRISNYAAIFYKPSPA